MSPLPAEVLRLLKAIEWQGSDVWHICPCCRASRSHGHLPDCDLAKKIAEAKG